MELPTQASLTTLAPNKNMNNIIKPMNQISGTIAAHRMAIGKSTRMERAGINKHLIHSIWGNTTERIEAQNDSGNLLIPAERKDAQLQRSFAAAGQSTQMIIGASNETDFELIRTTQNLYQAFDLKRVFYSGYIPINEDRDLPAIGTPVPMLREHRLYQADWLMRYYGFYAEELLSEQNPFFDNQLDPKCFWALTHLENFPVEINSAPAETLLRVPGIGPSGVKKILSARRYGTVNFEMLKKMHIVLKRAQYFITCGGKMIYQMPIEERFIRNQLTDLERTKVMEIEGQNVTYKQMNLFQDFAVR